MAVRLLFLLLHAFRPGIDIDEQTHGSQVVRNFWSRVWTVPRWRTHHDEGGLVIVAGYQYLASRIGGATTELSLLWDQPGHGGEQRVVVGPGGFYGLVQHWRSGLPCM